MAGVAYYSTLFTGQFYDGQICGRNRKKQFAQIGIILISSLTEEGA